VDDLASGPASPPVDVVLPCLDEAAALPAVLAGLPPGWRALVVDNGSTDGSAAVAAAHGATVVPEPRRGFGWACAAGLAAATAPVVAFADADASFDLRELPAVCAPVLSGAADLVLGRRRPVSAGAWPVHARAANRLLAARFRAADGRRLRDLGPMRAARRDALAALAVRDRRYGYPLETIVRASAAGWRIAEVDVSYLPRTGRSKVTGTVRGTVGAIRDMRRVLAEAAP
jgi:glycosyltransferase involved in cell wall biosynthesis